MNICFLLFYWLIWRDMMWVTWYKMIYLLLHTLYYQKRNVLTLPSFTPHNSKFNCLYNITYALDQFPRLQEYNQLRSLFTYIFIIRQNRYVISNESNANYNENKKRRASTVCMWDKHAYCCTLKNEINTRKKVFFFFDFTFFYYY